MSERPSSNRPACKRCGFEIGMLNETRHAEMHREILVELKRYLRETRGKDVPPQGARNWLVNAHTFAAFLTCADQGFCSACAPDMPEFAL